MVDVISSTKSFIHACIDTYVRFCFLKEECQSFRRTLRRVLIVLDDLRTELDDLHNAAAARRLPNAGGPTLAPNPLRSSRSSSSSFDEPMALLRRAAEEGGRVLERCTRMRVLPVLAMTGHLLVSLARARDGVDEALRMLQASSVGLHVANSRDLQLVRQDVADLRQHMAANPGGGGGPQNDAAGWGGVADLLRDELHRSHGVLMQSLVQELVRRGVVRDRKDCEDQLEELRIEVQEAKSAKALYDLELIEAVKKLSLQPTAAAATSPSEGGGRTVLESDIQPLLLCPISHQINRDPVIVIGSGVTYDRKHLCRSLLLRPDLDPVAGRSGGGPIRYVANNAVRDVIELLYGTASLRPYNDQAFLREYQEVWDRHASSPGEAVTIDPLPTPPVERSPGGGDTNYRPVPVVDHGRPPPSAPIEVATIPSDRARAVTPPSDRPRTATAGTQTRNDDPTPSSPASATSAASHHGPRAAREPSCLSVLPSGSRASIMSCAVWHERSGHGGTSPEWRAGCGNPYGTLTVWDPVRHRRVGSDRFVSALSAECCAVVFRNGTRALTEGEGAGSLQVLDLETDRTLYGLRSGPVSTASPPLCCSVFDDDTLAMAGFGDRTVKVWSLPGGEHLFTLRGHTGRVLCCAALQDFGGGGGASRAMTGGSDGILIVWDLARGTVLFQLHGHSCDVLCCAVHSPNGGGGAPYARSVAVSGGINGTVMVWDLVHPRALHALLGHTGPVHCCALFADGQRAVTGGADQTLRVWDVASGVALYHRPLRGHNGAVRCCSVFWNDSRLLSGGDDGTLRVWSLPDE